MGNRELSQAQLNTLESFAKKNAKVIGWSTLLGGPVVSVNGRDLRIVTANGGIEGV